MRIVDHTKNILEMKNVSFSYTGSDLAVQKVNLQVHRGDYLGIVGPNGGGKSTLLKLMLGLLKPKSGEIFRNWSKVGYISQQANHIDPNFPMTVEEIVKIGSHSKTGVQKSLEEVGMWNFRKRLIGDLSGGQQQRVLIARILAGEPEIVVLDEPTVGVDIKTQKQFYSLLQKLNKELNLTLILVSHELDVVEHEATEIAYINGPMVYYGFPKLFIQSEYFKKLTGKEKYHV